jgi:membrane-bound lytic murein transglycosylase A
MSMQRIRKYLEAHPEDMDRVFAYNPSYVFFRTSERGAVGCVGVPLTPGRSVATDRRLFPMGALAFVRCKKPVVNKGEISDWQDFGRFVLNQDTGGAIRGPGRLDLFWGSGPYAELAAGNLKHPGSMFFLIAAD